MNRSVKAALLCGLGASLVVACSAGGGQSDGQSQADGAHPPAAVSDGQALEARAVARTVLDEKIASSGQATELKAVSPELAAKLEAGYQASLKQRTGADLAAAQPQADAPANFDVLYARIRDASPGTRNVMLAEYVDAVNQVQDPAQRMTLFKRLEAFNITVY